MSQGSAAPPSLADRLVTACRHGDLEAAKAAVAAGASVNDKGSAGDVYGCPLAAASFKFRPWLRQQNAIEWLLSQGADPNGDSVMYYASRRGATSTVQLLIDVGGDVNRASGGARPLFWALDFRRGDVVRLLLAQPHLDLTLSNFSGSTPEQYARDMGSYDLADVIAEEVSCGE